MNKNDFVKAVAEKADITQKDTRTVLNALENVVYETLGRGEEVSIMNGLTVLTVVREQRTARNPITGEPIQVPEKRVPKVKIGSRLKKAAAFA